MLVLSRRIGETLQIGDDIQVTIQNISGNQVKVSISAPRHIPIHREEVARRISRLGGRPGEDRTSTPG